MVYILVHSDSRDEFIRRAQTTEFCDSAYAKKLFNMSLGDETGETWQQIELEMMPVVEGGKPFVESTYFLEGDGLVGLYV